MTSEAFNSIFSVGTSVNYHSIIGRPEHVKTITRSKARTLPNGQGVVQVAGKVGCVSLEAISIDPEVEKYAQMGQRIASHEWDCLCAGCIAFVEQGDKVHAMGLQA